VVEPHTRGGTAGLGYAFGDTATGTVVRDLLAGVVVGLDVRDTPGRVGGEALPLDITAGEYGYDLEIMFDGALAPIDGSLHPAEPRLERLGR